MTFSQAMEQRRSQYAIGADLPISKEKVEQIVAHAIKHVPSSFNAQSARVALLFGESHQRLWTITKESLRAIVPQEQFSATEQKIDGFAAGAGTILFFEDQEVIQSLVNKFELYAKNFPTWSEQSSGMLQYAVWTHLAEQHVGATLQHYNELIADEVKKTFSIPSNWKLIAQIPFGNITAPPKEKTFSPMEQRFIVFH